MSTVWCLNYWGGVESQQQISVLQDLDQAGFSVRKDQMGMSEVMLGIKMVGLFSCKIFTARQL
jgi:hypothetical protein